MGAPSPRPAASLSPSALETLRAGHEEARRTHGDAVVTLDELVAGVVARLRARREARGLEADDATLNASVAGLAVADVCLVLAADAGADAAWRRLHLAYGARLVGLVRARDGARADADAAVADLFADLALPPARGPARTRLGTFDGSAPLWAWLTTVLVNRLRRAGRDRLRLVDDAEVRADARAALVDEPGDAALDAETSAALDAAFATGWSRLEPHERCVVAWKHRHGLSQRRIAALLGVGEDRVSRWADRAVAKLRGAAGAVAEDGSGPFSEPRRRALVARLGTLLARLDTDVPSPPPPLSSDPASASSPVARLGASRP